MDERLKKVLLKMKEMLENEYPDYFRELYLFGSQVEKFNPDSDCDIATIFGKEKKWKPRESIMNILIDLGIEYDLVLDIQILSQEKLNKPIYLDNGNFNMSLRVKRSNLKVFTRTPERDCFVASSSQ